MRAIKKFLTILPLSVILMVILMLKFIRNPKKSFKSLKDNWNFINNGIEYDYTPTHSKTEEKKT
jgi:hypothetical protein